MDRNDFIKMVREKLDVINASINNHHERCENAAGDLRINYQDELKQLEKEKDKLSSDLEKLEHHEETLLEDARIGIETVVTQLQDRIRVLFSEFDIKAIDMQTANTCLKKYNESIFDYDVRIDIKELENEQNQMVATRLISIEKKGTGKIKTYPAGALSKQEWQIEFEKDLKSGYFK